MDNPSDFPYKHVVEVEFDTSDDGLNGPTHYKWLQEHVGAMAKIPHDSYYSYNGINVTVYGIGKGWCAAFGDYGSARIMSLRAQSKELDIIGIDDPEIALQFALKFAS